MAETIKGGIYRDGDRFVNANGEEVDASKAGEMKAAESGAPLGPDELPADFPGREALAEAKLTTYAAVRPLSRDLLIELKGIGEKTADAILDALKA